MGVALPELLSLAVAAALEVTPVRLAVAAAPEVTLVRPGLVVRPVPRVPAGLRLPEPVARQGRQGRRRVGRP
jgi:hypothetical protein